MAYDDVDIQVGARVRHRRRALGLSQTALGDRIQVSFQQIQKYENGKNRVSASRLHEIARALELPVEHLFGGPLQAALQPWAFMSKQELDLSMAYLKIRNATIRKSVIGLVEVLGGATTEDEDDLPEKVDVDQAAE